ncbi:MAG: hypothetical protein J5I41_12490 [Saprospiraceae bacterium]|nr:hypothetical protein [Saprospiraceae bacterium]
MIARMHKYIFVAHHDDFRDFLEDLRESGVAHIREHQQGWAPASEELVAKWQRYKAWHQMLEDRQVPALPDDQCPLAHDLVRELESRIEWRYALEQSLQNLKAQISLLQEWEDVPLGHFRQLAQNGVYAHFSRCPARTFQPEWKNRFTLVTFREGTDTVHFVLLTDRPAAPEIDAEPLSPPDMDPADLHARHGEVLAQIEENERGLNALAARRNALRQAMDALAGAVSWHQAMYQSRKDDSGKLIYLEAWVPDEHRKAFEHRLDQGQIVWMNLPVTPEDDIPVLLNNNRFARLFQPIGKLFALPSASELDLTAYFAPFFTLFFGLCLGDLGYGALLFLAGTVFKYLPAGKPYREALTLLQWLSFATMVVGVITGSLFSIPLANFAFFKPLAPYVLQSDQLFELALWIGLVQIAAGMLIRVFNRALQFGWVYGLAPAGWLIALVGAVMMWNEWAAPSNVWITLTGTALILLFSEPKGNIFKRVGLGLWELYGASGLVGDMLSYIRLFALGLSSSILGLVVNDIAMSVKGDGSIIGWLFFLIILAVGHGMNFFLATLSAFVHPMRLTFVEFYKNAGFSGGGKPYLPFSKKLNPEL